ncbi:flavodoxin family protein [Mangrovibacillus cuniculi]|uniref:Flavodoxin family protein n=1 Tax=Mangrovibacillus cuniculi TaxID=2593652 RepID=A0A7S8CD84_9BACI|nr:flavodoxin family protein [Mangrovibacillus cuniculi]QPC47823.1 flavodoxin family protein [Mangrovibacillus cuniculi]
MKTLVLLGSTRENGNSEWLAKEAVNGTEYTMVALADLSIQAIVDQRHKEGGFTHIQDDYDHLVELMLSHDRLIFATPLYWYGMSGPMKDFFDRWSQYLRDDRYQLKSELQKKENYVIISGGKDAGVKALPLVQQFAYIFEFMGMTFNDYVICKGVKPGEVKDDTIAVAKVHEWNQSFSK